MEMNSQKNISFAIKISISCGFEASSSHSSSLQIASVTLIHNDECTRKSVGLGLLYRQFSLKLKLTLQNADKVMAERLHFHE